jgi:putative inorganic carbon (hco3(-)) transporter
MRGSIRPRHAPRERLTFGHGAFAAVPNRGAAAAILVDEPRPVRLLRLDTWDWGWGGLLIFSLLVFIRPQDQISKVFGTAHLSDIAAVVGLIGMVVVNLSRRTAAVRLTPEAVGVLSLGALMLLLAPFSIWPGGVIGMMTGMFMQVTLIFLLMVNTITSPKRVERICRVIVVSFGIIAARVCFDYLRGVNLVEGDRASGPSDSFIGNPNDLALNLVAFLPLVLMYIRRPGAAGWRLLCAGIALLMGAALVFTKSRGGFVAAVAMLGTYLLLARMLTPGTVIALMLGGLLLVPALPSSFWERMASITDSSRDTTGSREERIELMKQAWRVFEQNPFTGIGAGQFENYSEPGQVQHWRVTHNTPLQLAAEVGIFGVLIMAFLFWRGIAAAWWTRRTLQRHVFGTWSRRAPPPEPQDGLEPDERRFLYEQATAMVACMVAWFVAAQFASVAYNWTIYYLLGLCVTARSVTLARARAYKRAKTMGRQEIVAA